jgi:hypothetical protein
MLKALRPGSYSRARSSVPPHTGSQIRMTICAMKYVSTML